jgi:hypothetical protein
MKIWAFPNQQLDNKMLLLKYKSIIFYEDRQFEVLMKSKLLGKRRLKVVFLIVIQLFLP